jgi:hypothetical protein
MIAVLRTVKSRIVPVSYFVNLSQKKKTREEKKKKKKKKYF